MTRLSYRLLTASAAATLLFAVFTVNGCSTADCNDTATCSRAVGSDYGPATGEAAVEASDDATFGDAPLATGDADSAVMNDGTPDETDVTVAPGDSGADADGPDVTVATDDGPAEAADADAGDSADAADAMDATDTYVAETGPDVRDVVTEPPPPPPPPKCLSNMLTSRVAASSSNNDVSTPASQAVDGVLSTRWESVQGLDPQWIYVDYGSAVFFNRVRILWETACGANYDIQTSNDKTVWSTMKTITGNAASSFGAPTNWSTAADHNGFAGVGRYLRIYGTARCTMYGYSIYEMEAFGDTNINCKP